MITISGKSINRYAYVYATGRSTFVLAYLDNDCPSEHVGEFVSVAKAVAAAEWLAPDTITILPSAQI